VRFVGWLQKLQNTSFWNAVCISVLGGHRFPSTARTTD
jgi:hypothetical protein